MTNIRFTLPEVSLPPFAQSPAIRAFGMFGSPRLELEHISAQQLLPKFDLLGRGTAANNYDYGRLHVPAFIDWNFVCVRILEEETPFQLRSLPSPRPLHAAVIRPKPTRSQPHGQR